LTGLKILVAEDNKLNQKIVNYIFQKKGAVVTMTNNGREAIDALSQSPYDVLILDLHMPVMDGYAAAKVIRTEMNNNIPIIALTASILPDDTDECLKIGINACISKPFDTDKVWDLINNLISANKH